MKMKDIKAENFLGGFTPIKVEFIVESEDELLQLWHRLKSDSMNTLLSSGYFEKHNYKKTEIYLLDLWSKIDDIRYIRHINLYDNSKETEQCDT